MRERAKVMVTDNGAKLVYTAADGWQSEITKQDHAIDANVCGYMKASAACRRRLFAEGD